MPVVMWGGIAGDLDRAKEIGFTHGLGISADYGRIWEAGKPTTLARRRTFSQGPSELSTKHSPRA